MTLTTRSKPQQGDLASCSQRCSTSTASSTNRRPMRRWRCSSSPSALPGRSRCCWWRKAMRATLVGFCQLYPSFCSVEAKPIYVLYDLFVAPTTRKTGAGRALMLAAEARARADGKARTDLTTAKTNLRAQALYESLGWVRDEVFYAYNKAV